jgi:hypothetical protein
MKMTAVMAFVLFFTARCMKRSSRLALAALEPMTKNATPCSIPPVNTASRNVMNPLLGEILYWSTVYANAYAGCRANHLPAYQDEFQKELAIYRTHLEFAIACFNLDRRQQLLNKSESSE